MYAEAGTGWTETAMAYTLKEFCADHHALLTSGQPLPSALPQIAEKLRPALGNPDFVTSNLQRRHAGRQADLHHDPDTDVYVLAHVYEGPKKGSPHSHGASWAVYGTARAVTEMTEWRRHQSGERRPCRAGGGEQLTAGPRPDQALAARA